MMLILVDLRTNNLFNICVCLKLRRLGSERSGGTVYVTKAGAAKSDRWLMFHQKSDFSRVDVKLWRLCKFECIP